MSEKAICIGQYFVASGRLHRFRHDLPDGRRGRNSMTCFLAGSRNKVSESGDLRRILSKWPLMIDHIDKKRAALGLSEQRERKLFSMEDRRSAEG